MSSNKTKAATPVAHEEPHANSHTPSSFWALTLGSVGVVYGDIGTSPLYAFKEALMAVSGHEKAGLVAPAQTTVIGLISLILWALILIVTVKYVLLLLRADNNGEGGTLALMALARKKVARGRMFVMFLGILGAALFYSDSMITPAISVLSAVEGIKVIAPSFEGLVLPLTVAILIGLFLVQSRGTAKVATFFGPITVLWFLAMAAGGLYHISDDWHILWAFNPYYAVNFLIENGKGSFLILGAVFLAVTGAEALYADLGHFGRKPIQAAWMGLVLPCLALNYLGQGALVLSDPKAIENPFFLLFPEWSLIPIVILATMATVIASQAVITGAFSITRQAIQLGLLPRLEIRHTSESQSGQIFIPKINTILLIGVLLLVLMFKTSSNIAHMYGIAVTGAMMVDAAMAMIVFHKVWKWSMPLSICVILPFFVIESVFLSANMLKVFQGGWVPLSICAYILYLVYTWRKGSRILFEKTRKAEVPLKSLLQSLEKRPPHIVQGTAVFLTSDPESAPTALLHNIKHNKVLHEKNVILTVITAPTPKVSDEDRVKIDHITDHFTLVSMTFGFMETPNIPKKLALCRKLGWTFDIMATSFFLSRRTLKIGRPPSMPMIQEKTFLVLVRNADNATNYFQIPTARVVEVGTQVTI